MVFDDNDLIQANATIISGVLILLLLTDGVISIFYIPAASGIILLAMVR